MSRYFRFPLAGRRRQSAARANADRTRQGIRLSLEALEDRTVPTAVAAPSGILSWWAGNGNAADSVGPNSGTLNNGVTFGPGEVGSAFTFNTTDYVSANTSGLPTGNSDRTLEMWVKANSFPSSGEAYFAGYGNFGSSNQTYHLGTTGSQLFWSQWGTGIGGPSLTPNVWYHVAVTNIGNSATLYLNGVPVGTNTVPIATPAGSSFYIGRIPGTLGDSRKLDGEVDEVSVYNRALTASEIQSIYNAGSDGKVLSPITVNNPSVLDGSAGANTPITFTITRTGSLSGSLTVNWTTADDTAKAGTDYVAASGTVTFASGQSTQTVPVTTLDNGNADPNIDFKLLTTPAGGVTIAGVGTIVNDEPVLNEIGDVSPFIASGTGGLSSPKGITLGPDGNLYVANGDSSVLRYNASTGAVMGTFVTAGSGGLNNPYSLAFGPDGNLYVASRGTSYAILCYNGSTGAFIKAFVPTGYAGLTGPNGITFGADGNLYVVDTSTSSVLRYEGPLGSSPGSPLPSTGQTGATFVASGSGGLAGPADLIFGPDGNLYVSSQTNHAVLKFDPSGNFIGTDVTPGEGGLVTPRGLAFDQDGRLYVADISSNTIHRYDSTGQYLDDLVASATTSLRSPLGIVFDAQGDLLVSSRDTNAISRYDRGVTVTLTAPSTSPVSVSYLTADGTASSGKDYTAESGTVTFAPGQTSRLILLATHLDPVADGNETFSVQVGTPTGGATLANGTTNVTIVDPNFPQLTIADSSAIEGDTTAHYRGPFVSDPTALAYYAVTFGPDRNLYTCPSGGQNNNNILRFNGTTGALMGTFVPAGTINGVRDIVFHNSYMFVSGEGSSEVFKFDAKTGASLGVFASGNITGSFGLAFGPDGNLYVSGRESASVVEYDGTTGAYIRTFIASGANGMSLPEGLTFDPSGQYLYVASSGTNQILKYNAQTGAFVGVAASDNTGLTYCKFGPDGLLYVLSNNTSRIMRFNENGTYIDDYLPAGSGGMSFGEAMTFGPTGDLYVVTNKNNQVLQFGTENEALFTVSLSATFAMPVTVNYATADGSAKAGTNYTAVLNGTLTFAPGGVTTQTIRVPILDSGSQTTPLTFTLNLYNPLAASLSRSQATGTIAPSDQAAKFYVVNEPNSGVGGNLATFKYQASGTEQAPFSLGLNDLTPMGITANAAGTMEWVVDANKNVYVYSPGGTLLGSWSAGGLSSSAQLTGIATNGTDIWLVDSYTDKVYKYTGAASRLSGSQSAASSFALVGGHNGNTNPQDIVTDGTSFWVVDGTKLKVFKYTLSGSLLGSWAIDPANTHPTGITINPNNVSDIWIVDSGTLKVYQYIGAASRTSGSQNAAATFALAPGDTNPQGIADPPTADLLPTVPYPESVTNSVALPVGPVDGSDSLTPGTQTGEVVNGRASDSWSAASAGSVASIRLASGGPAPFLADRAGLLAGAGDRVSLPSAARVGFPTSTPGVVGTGQPQGTLPVSLPRLVFPWNTDGAAVDIGFSVGEGSANLDVPAEPLGSSVLDLLFASQDEGSDFADLSAIP
jgi:sugar lactone lactonase YvrE